MKTFILLAIGGAAGTIARYTVAGVAQRWAGAAFPLGTFTVNMLGCLLFGLIWSVLETRAGLAGAIRLPVLTGFMGAFTTFSTYMFETTGLVQSGQFAFAALNAAGQTFLGLLLVLAGMALGHFI